MPPAVVALVTTGVAEPIVIVTGFVVVPVALVALTVMGNEPGAEGAPEIVETPSKVTPGGKVPLTPNEVGALLAVI